MTTTSTDLSTDSPGPMANSQKTRKRRKKKALGRGLGALIPKQAEGAADPARDYFSCELDAIEPASVQPRKHFDPDALADLSASIKESGLIQPLVVRRKDGAEDRYELIAGERRWRASRMAGLTEVPVVVKDVDDAVAFALALIENIQRQDLNPIEEAMAYERLIEEFEFTQAELAEQVGKSRSAISNAVRLLNLPELVQSKLAEGELTPGHARPLLTLEHEQAVDLAAAIEQEQLTVRQTEQLARELRDGASLADQLAEQEAEAEADDAQAAPERPSWRDDETTRALTSRLRERLGAPKIQLRDRHGQGRIEIHYDDYATLKGILERLELEEDFDLDD